VQYVFFTKTLRDRSVSDLIETLKRIGADGADLCVRDGYVVNPMNARKELPAVAKRFEMASLSVAMVSGPTDLHDPADPTAEALFAGCHDAGVRFLKPGYWTFREGPFQPQLDAARKELEGWERLAQHYGVRCCVHIHSGNYLTINTASTVLLVQDTDPARIGLYLDPGHLALNGEPAFMAVSMAGDRLALVAVKDLMWERTNDDRVRQTKCVPLGQGFVNWKEWWRTLRSAQYAGPVSVHSEYEDLDDAAMLEQARSDIQYLRKLEGELGTA
jgi:sugar phosphate isomerase/epimerase